MELSQRFAAGRLPFILASLEHEPMQEVAKRVGINFSLPEADMATPITTGSVIDEGAFSSVSWGAVLAGGIAAAAVTLVLLAFGVGVGFSVVSPWSDQGVSSTTLHLGAGIYLVVVAMLASTVGGYLAGRLRNRWAGVHHDEVYFRDTAHGFLAWAFATVLTATRARRRDHPHSGWRFGRCGAGGRGVGELGRQSDRQLCREAAARRCRYRPGGGRPDAARRCGRIRRLRPAGPREQLLRHARGTRPGDRKRHDARAAMCPPPIGPTPPRSWRRRTGLSQADAEKRVNDTIAQAKKAADDARKVAAKLSLWLAASMLAGALAASLAATEGGLLRDSPWYEAGWRPGPFGAERSAALKSLSNLKQEPTMPILLWLLGMPLSLILILMLLGGL